MKGIGLGKYWSVFLKWTVWWFCLIVNYTKVALLFLLLFCFCFLKKIKWRRNCDLNHIWPKMSECDGESVCPSGCWGRCVSVRMLGEVYVHQDAGVGVYLSGCWGKGVYFRTLGEGCVLQDAGPSRRICSYFYCYCCGSFRLFLTVLAKYSRIYLKQICLSLAYLVCIWTYSLYELNTQYLLNE